VSPKRKPRSRRNGGADGGPDGGDGRSPGKGPDVAALDRFLRSIGIDPTRDPIYGESAALTAELFAERTAGLREEIEPLSTIPYRGRPGESVAIEEIPIYGLCPHHLVPYFGDARVQYVPRAMVCGPGSLARLVRELATIPRIQESLTQAIADQVERALEPHSVEVVIRARHLCAEMRGEKQKIQLVTEARRAAKR
jgi:GTP cyclohydrolase I